MSLFRPKTRFGAKIRRSGHPEREEGLTFRGPAPSSKKYFHFIHNKLLFRLVPFCSRPLGRRRATGLNAFNSSYSRAGHEQLGRSAPRTTASAQTARPDPANPEKRSRPSRSDVSWPRMSGFRRFERVGGGVIVKLYSAPSCLHVWMPGHNRDMENGSVSRAGFDLFVVTLTEEEGRRRSKRIREASTAGIQSARPPSWKVYESLPFVENQSAEGVRTIPPWAGGDANGGRRDPFFRQCGNTTAECGADCKAGVQIVSAAPRVAKPVPEPLSGVGPAKIPRVKGGPPTTKICVPDARFPPNGGPTTFAVFDRTSCKFILHIDVQAAEYAAFRPLKRSELALDLRWSSKRCNCKSRQKRESPCASIQARGNARRPWPPITARTQRRSSVFRKFSESAEIIMKPFPSGLPLAAPERSAR